MKVAYEQQPAAVREWIEEQYPASKSEKRKVYLIVDEILRVHKAKAAIGWLAQRVDKIELFYLPPYSPELNADKYLNNTVNGRLRNQPAASIHSEADPENRAKG